MSSPVERRGYALPELSGTNLSRSELSFSEGRVLWLWLGFGIGRGVLSAPKIVVAAFTGAEPGHGFAHRKKRANCPRLRETGN